MPGKLHHGHLLQFFRQQRKKLLATHPQLIHHRRRRWSFHNFRQTEAFRCSGSVQRRFPSFLPHVLFAAEICSFAGRDHHKDLPQVAARFELAKSTFACALTERVKCTEGQVFFILNTARQPRELSRRQLADSVEESGPECLRRILVPDLQAGDQSSNRMRRINRQEIGSGLYFRVRSSVTNCGLTLQRCMRCGSSPPPESLVNSLEFKDDREGCVAVWGSISISQTGKRLACCHHDGLRIEPYLTGQETGRIVAGRIDATG